ncbi:MAG: hypothetical protein JSR26_02395 [Proteobacteria bacterium]|nr:hypothetical protein [Pseudomonadota bacterium]
MELGTFTVSTRLRASKVRAIWLAAGTTERLQLGLASAMPVAVQIGLLAAS